METTFLGLALPNVLQKLKTILKKKGFQVQTMPTSNPVIIAYQRGNWLRKPKQLVLEISAVENELTRIDITAIVDKKDSDYLEETIECGFVSVLAGVFNKSLSQ